MSFSALVSRRPNASANRRASEAPGPAAGASPGAAEQSSAAGSLTSRGKLIRQSARKSRGSWKPETPEICSATWRPELVVQRDPQPGEGAVQLAEVVPDGIPALQRASQRRAQHRVR